MKRDELFKHIRDFRKDKGAELKLGIECEIGEILYDFIVENKIKKIMETGVCHGFSSWYFLEALDITNGNLVSVEARPKDVIVVPEYLRERWTIIHKVSPEVLFHLFDDLGNVDFFWHDSEHTFGVQLGEFVVAMDHTKFIGGHDLYRTGAWVLFLKLFGRLGWKVVKHGWKYGIATQSSPRL